MRNAIAEPNWGEIVCFSRIQGTLKAELLIFLEKEGDFEAGDVVGICDRHGTEFAQGVAKYSREAMENNPGKVVVHRDHLVVL